MSRSCAAVDFEDGRRLYLIFDNTVDVAYRPLFETAKAAWAWYEAGLLEFAVPANAADTELPVTLTKDLHYDGNEGWQFASRASAEAMWLTGPRSRDELYQEALSNEEPYGGYFSQ